MPKSIKKTPDYTLLKTVTGVDTVFDNVDLGINTSYYKKANIQVIPSGDANPNVEVLWWSEEADLFIKEHTAITKDGIGANIPFEFTVDCLSRIMLVAVTLISTGSVKILVAGSELLSDTE